MLQRDDDRARAAARRTSAATNAGPFGSLSATRSPGPTPRSRRSRRDRGAPLELRVRHGSPSYSSAGRSPCSRGRVGEDVREVHDTEHYSQVP